MRGHIRKRGNKYVAVIYTGKDPITGKKNYKWLSGFKTEKEAEKALNEFIYKYEKGLYTDSENMTLAEYLKLWLKNSAQSKVEKTTYAGYETIVNSIIPALGNIKLSKLRPVTIQSFLTSLLENENFSNTYVRYHYTVLNNALGQAVAWQMINTNPCTAVVAPKKDNKEMEVLTEDQVNILLEGSKDTALYIPIVIALGTGMRRGEIAGLKWSNVDLSESKIYINNSRTQVNGVVIEKDVKTKRSRRQIVIPTSTTAILKSEKKRQLENKLRHGSSFADNDYVVCWDNGKPYRPDYLTKGFTRVIKKLDLPKIRFHDLRHTHASLLLLKGIHPKVVQERLGHSSISITLDTYSHILPTMQAEAANKLDAVFSN